jgi:aspartate aminotransferase
MYEHIYWAPEPFCSLLTAAPQLHERTVTVNGVSKSYAMTGWRIGYCGGPVEIVNAMSTIQSQSTSNPNSIAQRAATVALTGDQSGVAAMNRQFKARHDFFNAGLNALPGFRVLPAAGTFYAWCEVSGAIARLGLADDNAFAEHLLERANVAGVPGSGFGAPGHIRFSFAVARTTLEAALERIRAALA